VAGTGCNIVGSSVIKGDLFLLGLATENTNVIRSSNVEL